MFKIIIFCHPHAGFYQWLDISERPSSESFVAPWMAVDGWPRGTFALLTAPAASELAGRACGVKFNPDFFLSVSSPYRYPTCPKASPANMGPFMNKQMKYNPHCFIFALTLECIAHKRHRVVDRPSPYYVE